MDYILVRINQMTGECNKGSDGVDIHYADISPILD